MNDCYVTSSETLIAQTSIYSPLPVFGFVWTPILAYNNAVINSVRSYKNPPKTNKDLKS